MRTQGYLEIMDPLGVMETRLFGIQGISGFDSFFLSLRSHVGFLSWGVSILSSDLLSADQLPLLTHNCCSFTFGLLLGSGQLMAHQHPGSVQQTGFLSQDCWIVSALNTSFPSRLISTFRAT